MSSDNPVGVFDSGVGGLSVLREIRRVLPPEDLVYVADSAHAPYGDRAPEYIADRAVALVEFLVREGAKAVVVACNTATGIAVDALRARFPLPIVAIEPAVKPAAAATRSGVVGVMATTQTLASRRFLKLVDAHASGARVLVQPSPGLVEQVESLQLTAGATRALVEQYVRPLVEGGADTIVLGCTHYPFLTPIIQAAAGPGVAIVDPAVAVARELRRRLEAAELSAGADRKGKEIFWTTGPPDAVRRTIEALWDRGPIDLRHVE